jgi:hypothetical protein
MAQRTSAAAASGDHVVDLDGFERSHEPSQDC